MKIQAATILAFMMLSQLNCMGSAHYFELPTGVVEGGNGSEPINPDKFRVDTSRYPAFRIENDINPPDSDECSYGKCVKLPHVPILRGDKWQVTHVFKDRYIIESESYSKRQCNYLAKKKVWGFGGMLGYCTGVYDFGIYITADGIVSGGWALLPGSRKLFSERQTYLNPDSRYNDGWPSGVVFKEKKP